MGLAFLIIEEKLFYTGTVEDSLIHSIKLASMSCKWILQFICKAVIFLLKNILPLVMIFLYFWYSVFFLISVDL